MGKITIRLSSRERRGLFKAVQRAYGEDSCTYGDDQRLDSLLDELDDGGVWNPCDFHIPDIEDEQMLILYCLNMAIATGVSEEHATNVKSRMKYIITREDSKETAPAQPLFCSDGYYGPQWDTKREKAILRDSSRCARCEMTRSHHKEIHGHDLEVHHLVPKREHFTFGEANRLDNLVTLCKDCHSDHENNRSSDSTSPRKVLVQ